MMLTDKMKTRLIFMLMGIFAGMAITVFGGISLYKVVKGDYPAPRFAAKKLIKSVAAPKEEAPREQLVANEASKPLKEGFELFVASSLDRIFKDGRTLLPSNFSKTAKVSLARHEYENFQVVIANGQNALESVRFEISDLTGEDGQSKIAKENIDWRVVGYVPTKKPYYPVKYVGLWPDPLMPWDEAEVKPGETQPFWITVYAPKETPAGSYRGTIKITAKGVEPREIPLEVEVYNFTLPKGNSFKTAFDFYGHETKKRYPQGRNESDEAYWARIATINDKFIIEMLKYRMDPVLNVDPTNDYELAKVDRYLWLGMRNFSIGKRGGTLGNNWPKKEADLERLLPVYRLYGELLALNKMLKYHYIYTWDEGKIGEPQVAKVTNMIHRAHPKLKNMVCYHGFWNPNKDPDWGKDVDIWCFQISKFNQKKMDILKERGIEIWMYVSGPSGDNTPNLAMDFDSIDYRIIPWMSWKYDIKGFLYWCVNWWVKVDPFKSAANTKWAQNGNGLLFYPGESGPIPSLRASIYRDGMEDYEYLAMLKHKLQRFQEKGLDAKHKEVFERAAKLLVVDESIVKSTQSYTKNEKQLKQRRKAIAQTIEQVERLLSEEIVKVNQ